MAQSTLSYIENGKKSPQFDTLAAICRALDVSMLELLTYNEPDVDIKLLEESPTWLNILSQDQSGDGEMATFLRGDLPADALQEICAFERYLFYKYNQIENATTN